MSAQNLMERDDAPVARAEQDQSATLLSVIQRAATDPNVDIEKVERMFALYEKQQETTAKAQFNAALSRAQARMGRVSADAMNPQTRSSYASYAALDRALRPIYTEEGFAVSFDTEDCPIPDHVRVVMYLSHSGGYTRTYHRDMPSDGMGAKGGAVMTKTHAAGSAQSYGMRYLLRGAFNVAVGEDDDDGNTQSTITDEQAAELKTMLKDTGSDVAMFLKAMGGHASVDELPAGVYPKAKAALLKKAAKAKEGQ